MTVDPPRALKDINLADPDLFACGIPYDAFRLLRAEAPVHWNEGTAEFPGFWSITRYDDIVAVSRDTATFSSARGITMMVDPENPSPASGPGKMLITMDPPRHVRLRRLVSKGFTPRMVAQLEPHIRAITTGILDAVAARGACDFVTDVAARLPLAVICEMMGVPRPEWTRMFELTNMVLGADDPEYQAEQGDRLATANQGQREMFGRFAALLAERRRARREDLVSVLAEAEVDGERLTDEEILYFAYLLILAGNETTRNAISGGLLAFFEHPDQRARLAADPSLMPLAVEEIVRWTSPVLHMARSVTRDTELHGQPIRAGQKVILWYPSANRDETVFPDPDRFDVGRDPNEHIAFGIGEHFCLGAGLARLEIRVMFEELFRRLPDIAPAGPPERLRSTFIGGIKHLPVRYTPAG
jgi:cholest-4-en-3-one 26-monooxygenase